MSQDIDKVRKLLQVEVVLHKARLFLALNLFWAHLAFSREMIVECKVCLPLHQAQNCKMLIQKKKSLQNPLLLTPIPLVVCPCIEQILQIFAEHQLFYRLPSNQANRMMKS